MNPINYWYQKYLSLKAEMDKMKAEAVDGEKEFAHEYAIYHLPTFILASLVDGTELIDFIHKTARHFYELGKNSK